MLNMVWAWRFPENRVSTEEARKHLAKGRAARLQVGREEKLAAVRKAISQPEDVLDPYWMVESDFLLAAGQFNSATAFWCYYRDGQLEGSHCLLSRWRDILKDEKLTLLMDTDLNTLIESLSALSFHGEAVQAAEAKEFIAVRLLHAKMPLDLLDILRLTSGRENTRREYEMLSSSYRESGRDAEADAAHKLGILICPKDFFCAYNADGCLRGLLDCGAVTREEASRLGFPEVKPKNRTEVVQNLFDYVMGKSQAFLSLELKAQHDLRRQWVDEIVGNSKTTLPKPAQ